ncbi:glutamate receptor 2.9-like [Cornus florida]|uniref:glutamate receptor 2.9-like n=1 Tax=Cornus florida TaxID=4283 RepID=UPI00289B1ABE|nr:glutamate receptor 2.9-like [Cornus florida]
MGTFGHLFFTIMALALFTYPQKVIAYQGMNHTTATNLVKGIIGAIVDYTSRIGKEERVAMEMAIDDFNSLTNQTLTLRVMNSQGETFQAGLAARDLIDKEGVKAILGPQTWEETSAVAEICSQYSHTIPLLSLADAAPAWATTRWPFLIQASPSQDTQMKAVAAVVQSCRWRRVVFIYEDSVSSANGLVHLSDALREVGAEIGRFLALSPYNDLSQELERLEGDQCRVFLVHSSLPMAIRVFETAKKLKMMQKDYVWITTDSTTSLVHYINHSSISSMQGVLGIRRYFRDPRTHLHDFYLKFRKKFALEHPEEENHEPGIFALQAYDATKAVASAIQEGDREGQQLLEKISSSDFKGLSGNVKFVGKRLAPAKVFQIVNVIGRSYKEHGFWTFKKGFSETIDEGAIYSDSMDTLGIVIWPGGPRYTPRGWTLRTIDKPLRIGVPNGSLTNRFVNVQYHPSTKNYTIKGFSIEVFRKTVERLPYYLPYELITWGGNYTSLVEQVHLKNFDAAVGDIAIISKRYEYVEFTHPHTVSGLVMVVPVQSQSSNNTWLFMKPFTTKMWILTAVINIYNGFVVWMIERNHCPELKGSSVNQLGTLLWLAFSALFPVQGERLHSNLSRMATVVWLFVALIITQSYTASLTSMLTVQSLQPKVADIGTLKSSNAYIGYSNKSFVVSYLVGVLNFSNNNVKSYSTPEGYAQALKSGEIAAAFLEVPVAKLFIAKYCKSFIMAGPTYKVGGYGFAFPKGSLMLPDIDAALLNVSESGVLRHLEERLAAEEKCVEVESDNKTASLSPNSFWVLFVFTGGISTIALIIYGVRGTWSTGHFMLKQKSIWMFIVVTMEKWRLQQNRFFRKVSDVESPKNLPNASNTWVQMSHV